MKDLSSYLKLGSVVKESKEYVDIIDHTCHPNICPNHRSVSVKPFLTKQYSEKNRAIYIMGPIVC